MKHMEVASTWNVFMEVITHLAPEMVEDNEKRKNIYCEMNIKEECKNLAKYFAFEDIGNGIKSKIELEKMERAGEIVNSHIFVRLARHFYLLGAVEGEETKVLCDLLQTLYAFLGNQYYYCVEEKTIERLILFGINFRPKYHYKCNVFDERMAESALYLKELGFALSVKQGTISYSEETGQKLFELLERKVATIGGNVLLEKIMPKYLAECYIPQMDRYLYGRKVDEEKNEPFNLLLLLSAKHIKLRRCRSAFMDVETYILNSKKFACLRSL